MSITAVTVVYNTPKLIKECIDSFKKIYPLIPIVIIDGSPVNSECYTICDQLTRKYFKVNVLHLKTNVGHGRGLDRAIKMLTTEYVLVMDSDTELKQPCLALMKASLGDAYGIGEVVIVNENGINVDEGIDYLHPYFALIKRDKYLQNPPFIHHGAPFIGTMKHLKETKVPVKNFGLNGFVLHKERGTRNVIERMKSKGAQIIRKGRRVA